MTLRTELLDQLVISSEHDYNDQDPDDRGPFVIIGAPGIIDGNVMEIYGESVEEARADAEKILAALARAAVFEQMTKTPPHTNNMPLSKAYLNGAGMISEERQRQIEQEGYTPGHDDEHKMGELALAAAAYATQAAVDVQGLVGPAERRWSAWPWGSGTWKPSDDPIRNLSKAGALIAAEIDRLQRAQSS